MTYQEYSELFRRDENGRFINLVIPANDRHGELNLINKAPEDFTLDDVIRMKTYANLMFKSVDKTTIE